MSSLAVENVSLKTSGVVCRAFFIMTLLFALLTQVIEAETSTLWFGAVFIVMITTSSIYGAVMSDMKIDDARLYTYLKFAIGAIAGSAVVFILVRVCGLTPAFTTVFIQKALTAFVATFVANDLGSTMLLTYAKNCNK